VQPYYDDGACVIYHGDCRDILPQLGPVDHVITDPPYSADVYIRATGHNTKKGSRTPDKLYKGESMAQLATLAIGEMDDALMNVVASWAAQGVRRWFLVFSDIESTYLWRKALTERLEFNSSLGRARAPMRYARTGVWVKRNGMPQMSGDRPAVGFEPCTICHAHGPMRWNGGGKLGVWQYGTNTGTNRPDHPCPKPDGLMAELVTDFTDPGESILDPFMGSGTTLLAAKRLGRRGIGVEREEKYCEIAAKRLAQGALDLFGEATA
jgi:DNA modification methylase